MMNVLREAEVGCVLKKCTWNLKNIAVFLIEIFCTGGDYKG